jgi:hypothetical protein
VRVPSQPDRIVEPVDASLHYIGGPSDLANEVAEPTASPVNCATGA